MGTKVGDVRRISQIPDQGSHRLKVVFQENKSSDHSENGLKKAQCGGCREASTAASLEEQGSSTELGGKGLPGTASEGEG